MSTQPKQFGTEYASIFQDASVVAAYPNRAPYPAETFVRLAELIDQTLFPVRLLDAGCGTGQMTRGLLPHVDQIDAVDLSAAMIAAGQSMDYGRDPRINWIIGDIEKVKLHPPYALIVAAASLHWMPWDKTLPRFAQLLSPNGYLALVETRAEGAVWADELAPLFAHYSMNQAFQPYNMVTIAAELERRALFRQVGLFETQPVPFRQSVAGWIEAIHAGNGFSRDRMDAATAADFDQQLHTLVAQYCPDGVVEQQIRARIVFGKALVAIQ